MCYEWPWNYFFLFTDKLIMAEDNVQMGTIPNEQSQTGNVMDAQRCPHTLDDAVYCLLETAHETQNQVKAMKDSLKSMTSQLIEVVTWQIVANKSNQ